MTELSSMVPTVRFHELRRRWNLARRWHFKWSIDSEMASLVTVAGREKKMARWGRWCGLTPAESTAMRWIWAAAFVSSIGGFPAGFWLPWQQWWDGRLKSFELVPCLAGEVARKWIQIWVGFSRFESSCRVKTGQPGLAASLPLSLSLNL